MLLLLVKIADNYQNCQYCKRFHPNTNEPDIPYIAQLIN